MTGMPAWRDHTDEELWATVAFIKKLPGMSEQDYARLVMANIKSSVMHHHGGAQAMPDMEDSHQQGHAAPITQPKPRVQDAHNHP